MLAAPTRSDDWILLVGGLFVLVATWRSLATGSVMFLLGRTSVKRSEDASLYWCCICFYVVIGVMSILMFFLKMIGMLPKSWT